MKLHTLSATFGKLHRQTLELKDGLNIIEAPNEAGKSTWAGFLRAMLYGIDTRARDKKGVIAEKNRYQPWDGGAMEGSIRLTWQGRDITLRRTGKGNSPMSRFEAVYTGTEEAVPGLSADSVGELLTGVGQEAFERSAFVGQTAMAVTGSAELERRISAIVSSGQEDVSYSEAEQRLRDWKNRRQSNQKNGLIPRLEEEKAALSATLERLEQANRQASEARERIRELETEQAVLEQQATAHRALENARAWERYADAKAELDAAHAQWEALQAERQKRGTPPDGETLRRMQGELAYLNTLDANIKQARREAEAAGGAPTLPEHPVFTGMEFEAVKARATADAQTLKDFQDTPAGGLPWRTRLEIMAALLVACAGAVVLDLTEQPPLFTGLLLALCALAVVFLLVRGLVRHGKAMKQAARIKELYGLDDPVAIVKQAKQFLSDRKAAEEALREYALRTVTLERWEVERSDLAERLMDAIHPFAPEVGDLFGLSAAISLALNWEEQQRAALQRMSSAEKVLQATTAQGVPEPAAAPSQLPGQDEQTVLARLNAVRYELARQNEALAMAQGQMHSLGDITALEARRSELEAALARRREEYDALLLAMESLDEANALLQERMSPALNARAGELFHRLTGGRYDKVSLTREFEALASRQGDVTPRRLLTLSKGTADQLYLAVRLAVCDLVLPGDDPAPLVLDDALVHFDDQRLALALDLLRELAQTRQILLFTCQSRERLYLQDDPHVHVTRLQS